MTHVYRKKIQRKKNWNKDKDINNSYQSGNLLSNKQKNKKDILYNQKKYSIKNRVNLLGQNMDNKVHLSLNNAKSGNFDINKNTNNLILLTSLSHKKNADTNTNANINMNMNMNKQNIYFNCEHVPNNKLIKHYFTDLRYKKDYSIRTGTQKLNNNNNNAMINSGNLNDYSNINYESILNLDYYLAKKENNNFGKNKNNKNCFTLYSNNTSEYNTVNTLNNYSPRKIYIRKPFSGKKSFTKNNSKKKVLRNVITSIEYSNENFKKSNNFHKAKKIILSEVGSNGKINIKIKKNKNCIEKVLRNNSFNKSKVKAYLQKK